MSTPEFNINDLKRATTEAALDPLESDYSSTDATTNDSDTLYFSSDNTSDDNEDQFNEQFNENCTTVMVKKCPNTITEQPSTPVKNVAFDDRVKGSYITTAKSRKCYSKERAIKLEAKHPAPSPKTQEQRAQMLFKLSAKMRMQMTPIHQ